MRRAVAAVVAGSVAGVGRAAAAAPAWVDHREVGPFRVRSTFPLTGGRSALGPLRQRPADESDVLEAADLGELEAELRRVLGLRPCSETIEVWLYRNQREHRAAVSRAQPQAPYRRALFVKQKGRALVLAYRQAELPLDLRHEGTHALLHADLPMVPLWLDEGLASYFQAPADQRALGGVFYEPLMKDLRRGRMTPLAELEQRHELAEMSARDYRFAWAWAHFLLHGPAAATEALWATVASLRRWQPPEPLSRRLARAIPQPEAQLGRHFLQIWPTRIRSAARSGGAESAGHDGKPGG